jgi:hypothetical protein
MNMQTLAKLTTEPAPTVSPNYVFLSTAQAHEVLAEFGFFESRYKQGKGTGYQKHVSIFERETDSDEDGRFNLMLLNSHNGTSSLRLEAGYFRVLCENQLVHGKVGVRIPHRGQALDRFAEAIPLVLQQMQQFKETKALLRDKVLDGESQLELADFALQVRGIDTAGLTMLSAIRNQQNILTSRRQADRSPSAWHRFNAVQENIIKGGVRLYQGEHYRILRPITAAERLLDINQRLTEKAVELARAA